MKKYYVYKHIDRFDKGGDTVVYIGHGSGSRAWVCSKPHRDEEHLDFLDKLLQRGDVPSDWVEIVQQRLTKKQACDLERRLIRQYKPKFNKIQGAALLKVTPELLAEAFEMRDAGMSYAKIAENLAISAMTVHRAMAGKSPALEEIIERQET